MANYSDPFEGVTGKAYTPPVLPVSDMDRANQLAGKVGGYMTQNAAPLTLLAQMLNNYGRSTTAAPQQNLDLITKMLAGQTGSKTLAPAKPAVPAAQPPAPAPMQKATEFASPQEVPAQRQESGVNSKMKQLPFLMENPTQGASEQVVGTPASSTIPAPYIQNLNEGGVNPTDVGNLSWMLPGGATEALKVVQDTISNSLNQRRVGVDERGASVAERGASVAERNAAVNEAGIPISQQNASTQARLAEVQGTNSQINLMEAIMKGVKLPEEIKKISAETAKLTGEADPVKVAELAAAKQRGELQANTVEAQQFAESPAGKVALDKDIVSSLKLPVKTVGELRMLFPKDYDKIIGQYGQIQQAKIAAGGAVKAAEAQNKFGNMILDGLKNGIDSDQKFIDQTEKKFIDLSNVPPEKVNLQVMISGKQPMPPALIADLQEAKKRLSARNLLYGNALVNFAQQKSIDLTSPSTVTEIYTPSTAKEGQSQYTDKAIVVQGYQVPAGSTYRIVNGKVQIKKGK